MSSASDASRTAGEERPAQRYDAGLAEKVETKWQTLWDERQSFRQPNPGEEGFEADRPKFYCLDMFPYPSGAGLHVGHPEGYTATDILCRFKRMRGFNVLHPMGWDAFGLPAEQYAIQTGIHPRKTTAQAIENFRRQLKRFGFSYDWSREFGTIDPDYYRWTQWIFLTIYNSWFDVDQNRARPIQELVEEFEGGRRRVCLNPNAAEFSREDKAEAYGDWACLDKTRQRKVIDSYRLCYLAEQTVNWCPKLGTALANEEVIDGRSERGDFPVYRKPLRQWMFRITAYGERLEVGLTHLDWPSSTQSKQRDWIGRSRGAEVVFEVENAPAGQDKLTVYTTRPDTLFGATYMVVAPEHPLVDGLLAREQAAPGAELRAVQDYVAEARNRSDLDRQTDKEKTGVPTGLLAVNPVNQARIPIWVADYVLMGYGTGAIMAVPGGDERDHEFATKFGLPIVTVVRPDGASDDPEGCYAGEGVAVRSANDELSLNGMRTPEAKRAIIQWLVGKGLGQGKTQFKLRDWLFSRQRYWGEPFPIVFDEEGNHHPVSPERLPVTLPELSDYAPEESDEPKPLLAKAKDWVSCTAEQAGVTTLPPSATVRRETNTMPGWAGSCWYYLRFCDPKNSERLVGEQAERYWMGDRGVDLYIGGAEHAVLHLLYARFWHLVLYDRGVVGSPEPFAKLFHQGLIMSYAYRDASKRILPTDAVENRGSEEAPEWTSKETGESVSQIVTKMSKSLKNVVNPDDVIQDYGADTFRLYEMYMGPLDISKPWNTRDIVGMYRFLQRAWRLLVDEETGALKLADSRNDGKEQAVERKLHRTIAGVTDDIEKLSFNTAIAKLIEFVNLATGSGGLGPNQVSRFIRLLSPFVPHMAEELWEKAGQNDAVRAVDAASGLSGEALLSPGLAMEAPWPTWDENQLVDESVEIAIQITGKMRARIQMPRDADRETQERLALADERVKALLVDKKIQKVIVVPGRLVNIVAK